MNYSLVLVQPSTKRALALSRIWELAIIALDAPSDDATRGLADVLTAVVADQRCMDALKQGPRSTESDETRYETL